MNASQAPMIARFSASLGRAGRVVRRSQALFFWVISDRFSTAVSCSARLIGIAILNRLSASCVLRLRPLVIGARAEMRRRAAQPGVKAQWGLMSAESDDSKTPGIWVRGAPPLGYY